MNVMDTNQQDLQNRLRRRASLLALPLRDTKGVDRYSEILVFIVSGERYAIAAEKISRVAPCTRLCPIPGTPEHILGMVNITGELLPLIDLGPRFGLARGGPPEDSRIIVLENATMKLGLFAERVIGSESVNERELMPPLQMGNRLAAYLLNTLSDGTMLMDADAILADVSLIVDEK
jgi:purine-binding chemotaxis protein CheW